MDTCGTPGFATTKDLETFFGVCYEKLSDITTKRGIVRGQDGYAWVAIWRAIGIHDPPPEAWDQLKRPLISAREAETICGIHEKTIRRWRGKADRARPDVLDFGPQSLRFRRDQVKAYGLALEIPRYEARAKPTTGADVTGLGAYPQTQ